MRNQAGLDFGFHRIFVEGRLRTRGYTDADGNRRFVTEVVGDTVRLLGSPVQREDASAETVDAPAEPVSARRRAARGKAA